MPGRIAHAVGRAMTFAGAGSATMAIYLFANDAVSRYRTGAWPEYPFGQLLSDWSVPAPASGWPAFQSIIDGLMACSAVDFLACGGMLLILLGVSLTEGYG